MAEKSKWVENTVGKGQIARYEQFLLFPQCFQKACFPGASKGVILWKWLKKTPISGSLKVPHKVENIVRKGEIAFSKQFLLFS